MLLKDALAKFGLIAILRGVLPDEALYVASVLYEAGFRVIEVPLNSPDAIVSIGTISHAIPEDCLVGAGTVYRVAQVNEVMEAGGTLIVMPHGDKAIIEAALASELEVLPGVATASEAFSAFSAGANVLKVFPAEQLGVEVMRAWRAVLPSEVGLVPVGGIDSGHLAKFLRAGALGFGIGSSLYKPGVSLAALNERARHLVVAWQEAQANCPRT